MTAQQRRDQDNNRGRPQVEELRPKGGFVPPSDLDAEAAVLSGCMLDAHALDLCVGLQLRPEYFYSHANRLIFETMLLLREAAEPVDVVTVAGSLKDRDLLNRVGGSPYLAQVVDSTPAIQNVETHALRIRDKWRQRHLIAILKARGAEGFGHLEDVQEWIDAVEADVAELARHFDHSRGMRSIGEAGASALARISEAERQGTQVIVGVPFGYSMVDRKTKGMMPSDLFVVAARPGMGKTSFALGVAMNVAAPRRDPDTGRYNWGDGSVGFFSLEMDEEQLALRGIAVHERLNAQRLRSFEVAGHEWGKFTDGVAYEQWLSVHIDPTPGLTAPEIRSRARRLASDLERRGLPPLRLVIVDYLQIMGALYTGQPNEERVASAARGLKALAKELKIPVMALAQLNRDVERRTSKDKRPQLSDLRESGAIEQEADTVAFLYRDEYYFPETPDAGLAEFILRKQRSGPVGTVKLRFTPEYTRFDNLEGHPDDYDDLLDDYEDRSTR